VAEICITCSHLHDCSHVTREMIEKWGSCSGWAPATTTEMTANKDIISDFGTWALGYDVMNLQTKGADKKLKVRRRHKNG
jgi:hypothetical protein